MRSKNHNSNRSFKNDKFIIIQWNAGALSKQKKTELTKLITDKQTDVFTIMESNIGTDDFPKFQFPGYNVYFLAKH